MGGCHEFHIQTSIWGDHLISITRMKRLFSALCEGTSKRSQLVSYRRRLFLDGRLLTRIESSSPKLQLASCAATPWRALAFASTRMPTVPHPMRGLHIWVPPTQRPLCRGAVDQPRRDSYKRPSYSVPVPLGFCGCQHCRCWPGPRSRAGADGEFLVVNEQRPRAGPPQSGNAPCRLTLVRVSVPQAWTAPC